MPPFGPANKTMFGRSSSSSSLEIRGNIGTQGEAPRVEATRPGQAPKAEEESEEFKRHTYKPKPGQDIYGRTIGPTKGGATPAAYVPPHLRAAAAAAAEGGTASGGTAPDKFGGNVKRAEVQVRSRSW